MSFLSNLFKSSSSSNASQPKLAWNELKTVEQLNEIEAASHEKLQVIFKHSTRCGISRTVLNMFEREYPEGLEAKLYYLDLLNYRDVSSAIATKFEIIHQSPQVIAIDKGSVVYAASHHEIDVTKLQVNH